MQQLMRNLAERLLAGPPVLFLGAPVPIGDGLVEIADENGLMRDVEQASALPRRYLGGLVEQGEVRGDADRSQADDEVDDGVGTTSGGGSDRPQPQPFAGIAGSVGEPVAAAEHNAPMSVHLSGMNGTGALRQFVPEAARLSSDFGYGAAGKQFRRIARVPAEHTSPFEPRFAGQCGL